MFPMETIVPSNLTDKNNSLNQRKCFIILGADCHNAEITIWYVISELNILKRTSTL